MIFVKSLIDSILSRTASERAPSAQRYGQQRSCCFLFVPKLLYLSYVNLLKSQV